MTQTVGERGERERKMKESSLDWDELMIVTVRPVEPNQPVDCMDIESIDEGTVKKDESVSIDCTGWLVLKTTN